MRPPHTEFSVQTSGHISFRISLFGITAFIEGTVPLTSLSNHATERGILVNEN